MKTIKIMITKNSITILTNGCLDKKSKIMHSFFFSLSDLNFRRLIFFVFLSFNNPWTISNKNVLCGKKKIYTTGLDVSLEIYNDFYYCPFDFSFVIQVTRPKKNDFSNGLKEHDIRRHSR